MELNWVKKQRTSAATLTSDVRFGFNANKSVSITFSAAAISTKFHNAEHIEFAISGSRIYFRESDPKYGFKLSRAHGAKAGKAQIKNDDLSDFLHKNHHIWETNLKYDSVNELYYVDASKRDLDWKGA